MPRFLPASLALLVLVGLAAGLPAHAQTTARVTLYNLDTSSFPEISIGMDVFDASGALVTGLAPDQVTLFEDNLPIPLSSLREPQPGVQFALALDAGKVFAFRDIYAVSRLDVLSDVLRNWTDEHSDSFEDDLTLVTNGGIISSHLTALGFRDALSAYQPDLQTLDSSLTTLSRALDMVAEPGSHKGMKRVVLYITSPPDAASIPALQNLTQRALSLEARVHVWIVASSDFFATSGATALKDLSILTGGTYALFSGTETLPNPEVYLTPLRQTYKLAYPSAIRATGTHTLSVEIIDNGAAIPSDPVSFSFTIEPPNPILVSPPHQVVRQGSDPRSIDYASFEPVSQEIEAIIEFPDGLVRPLARSALYVDGVLMDENTAEPFDRFTWDLSGLTSSGDHLLELQASDTLGLEKTSLGLTVTVTVVQPERGVKAYLARNSLWVTLGAVGSALIVLVATLLVASRRRKNLARKPRSGARQNPLTAEVESSLEGASNRSPGRRASTATRLPPAWLQRLKEDGQPLSSPPVPITSPEIIFGSDPIQATRVLDDPSVSPLHARLRVEAGKYILSDQGSVAGTWLNYEQITAPHPLRHGDVFQVGRIAYRFLTKLPGEPSSPRITPITRK